MLRLTGRSNFEQYAPILPDAGLSGRPFATTGPGSPAEWAAAGYPISVSDAFGLALHNDLLRLAREWQGAVVRDLWCEDEAPAIHRAGCTTTFPATPLGFSNFASGYFSAAGELLDKAGRGPHALPPQAGSAILTMVAHRVAATDYQGSLSQPGGPSAALADVGFIGPNATVAVTTQEGVVTDVVFGTNLQVGQKLDLVKTSPAVVPVDPGSETVSLAPSMAAATSSSTGAAAALPAGTIRLPIIGAVPQRQLLLAGAAAVGLYLLSRS
jgi:hypothetical protein